MRLRVAIFIPSVGQIIRKICDPLGLDLVSEIRLYTLINVGMADAGIACWHHKYVYNFWRPVVGIREAAFGAGPSGRGDTYNATDGDPFWCPQGFLCWLSMVPQRARKKGE